MNAQELYRILDERDEYDAMDYMYDTVDQALCRGDVDEIGDFLKGLDPARSLVLAVGGLTITLPLASHIPHRQDLYDRIHRYAVEQGRDADRLLSGLGVENQERAMEAHLTIQAAINMGLVANHVIKGPDDGSV